MTERKARTPHIFPRFLRGRCEIPRISDTHCNGVLQVRETGVPGKRSMLGWETGVPGKRSMLGWETGVPGKRSMLGWETGVPGKRSMLGWETGVPGKRSMLGWETGVPGKRSMLGWETGVPGKRSMLGWEANMGDHCCIYNWPSTKISRQLSPGSLSHSIDQRRKGTIGFVVSVYKPACSCLDASQHSWAICMPSSVGITHAAILDPAVESLPSISIRFSLA